MAKQPTSPNTPTVMIVDDNRAYREAFTRNLLIQGYEVVEAEDGAEAIEKLNHQPVDVIVTDLAMRHPTEGLDLIRQTRSLQPFLPIIMISAVGTFEEGAEASRLGAGHVISKSRIDAEIDRLYQAIDQAYAQYQTVRGYARRLQRLAEDAIRDPAGAADALRQMILDPEAPDPIKGAAFDQLQELSPSELNTQMRRDIERVQSATTVTRDLFDKVEANLGQAIPKFKDLSHDTAEAIRTAEFLYLHDEQIDKIVDFSRSIGFSYCFAVENEAKYRLRKKLQKFFNSPDMPSLVKSLLEKNHKSVSLFFHQHLLRVQRDVNMDITIDNVFQTFQRMLEHRGKYKPDGLKALGIVLVCFGRTYCFRKFDREIAVANPLNLKGPDGDDQVIRLASLLTNLQHYRNPYIHPEISEMEKLSKIRDTSFDCMNMIMELQ